MKENIIFTEWTRNKRHLSDLKQLKRDILHNFQEHNALNKKIISMLSGGKDSSTALALAKDLGLNVVLAVHFVHKWSWSLSKEQARRIANEFEVPIVFCDITEDLKKRTNGAKGGSICRICKNIMKDKIIKLSKEKGVPIILTGDTALEKISGPIIQYLRKIYNEEKFEKMELTPVPKRYGTLFFRPLIRCGHEDVIKLKNYYGINIERIHEVGDKFGYWREGCSLQYCDYSTKITEELLDKLYLYNKEITDLARRDGRFRASIKLPSKELLVAPVENVKDITHREKEEFIRKLKNILNW